MFNFVYCNLRFVGSHSWPEAPDSLAYLRSDHRHEFHVKVCVQVNTLNRQVEFHTLKKVAEEFCNSNYAGRSTNLSCEAMATCLADFLLRNGYVVRSVDFSEDGECGGIAGYE